MLLFNLPALVIANFLAYILNRLQVDTIKGKLIINELIKSLYVNLHSAHNLSEPLNYLNVCT